MIESFGDRATEDLFHGRNTTRVRRLPTQILNAALNKLDVLNNTFVSYAALILPNLAICVEMS